MKRLLLPFFLLAASAAAQNVGVQVNQSTGVLWRPSSFEKFLVPSQTGHSGKYLTTNGTTTSWATVSGGGGTWGSITGTLSNQTDLQSALDAKQGLDSDLTAIAALTTTSFGRSFLELANSAAGRTLLGVVIGTDVQAYDSDLASIAALATTSFGRSLLTSADASALRTTAGLVIGTDVQAFDADLSTYAGITPSANVQTFLGAANYAAMRTQLGLVIGTDVQAYDADLASWASVTRASGFDTFTATPSSANLRSALTDETGTGAAVFASDPLLLAPGSAMGALAVDVTKRSNTKTVSADSTLTFSATATAGATFGLRLTNSDSAAHTITIPSSHSYARGTAITTFNLQAGAVAELSWHYDGTTYFLVGDPTTIADLSSITAASGDYVALHDVSAGTDGRATIASVVATQIGTAVQAYDADLTTYAGITPSANVQSLLGAANYAAMRALLDLEAGTDFLAYPTGTPTGSKFLRDDNSWQAIAAGGDFSSNTSSSVDSELVLFSGTGGKTGKRATGTGYVKVTSGVMDTPAATVPIADLGTSTSAALGVGSVELGHASDTTITRTSAGNIAVEGNTIFRAGGSFVGLPDLWVIAISDESTAITTGTAKVTFRAPYAATVTAVRASLTTASSSGTPTFDINESGTSILSTKLTIDASEKTSTTAATAAVISDSALADDAEITIDVDTAGTGAAGAKIVIYVTRA